MKNKKEKPKDGWKALGIVAVVLIVLFLIVSFAQNTFYGKSFLVFQEKCEEEIEFDRDYWLSPGEYRVFNAMHNNGMWIDKIHMRDFTARLSEFRYADEVCRKILPENGINLSEITHIESYPLGPPLERRDGIPELKGHYYELHCSFERVTKTGEINYTRGEDGLVFYNVQFTVPEEADPSKMELTRRENNEWKLQNTAKYWNMHVRLVSDPLLICQDTRLDDEEDETFKYFSNSMISNRAKMNKLKDDGICIGHVGMECVIWKYGDYTIHIENE